MLKRIPFFLVAFTACCIGLYPIIYFVFDREFGLLGGKPDLLLNDILWNIGFYSHIILGGLALLVGWFQFNKKWRDKNISRHRQVGKVYAYSVLVSGLAGVYIGFYATGGWIAETGFIALGIIWLLSTFLAVAAAKSGDIVRHQSMMYYSYAACFAAVTLRIWLPLLTTAFEGNFIKAYRIVAWLSWVPNLLVAYFLQKKLISR